MRHIISALVNNKPGVLCRIAGLFSARGYNIESLAVGETEAAELSRMTIVAIGDEKVLEQVRKQLEKLIDVVKVQDYFDKPHVERDLMLIKVKAPPEKRSELLEIAQVFRGRVVDVSEKKLVLEVSGTESKINAFLKLMKPYGIVEMVRTGRIALGRGE